MRAVVQRVRRAEVTVGGVVTGAIGPGLLVYVGVAAGDGPSDVEYISSKVSEMRVFADDAGRMNRSVAEAGGALLVVSQFTLLGDLRKGRRPSFDAAEPAAGARSLFDAVVASLGRGGVPVSTGVFQADMRVASENDGPVTLLLDSRRLL